VIVEKNMHNPAVCQSCESIITSGVHHMIILHQANYHCHYNEVLESADVPLSISYTGIVIAPADESVSIVIATSASPTCLLRSGAHYM
jgi:hypothetical protein